MRTFTSLMIATTLFLSGCGGKTGPGDVVREFFGHLQHGRTDSAMELLTQDLHQEMLEEFEGKQIVRFTIEMVYISEDGCSATVNWSTEVIDENSSDTNEGDEWELTRTSDGTWLISDL